MGRDERPAEETAAMKPLVSLASHTRLKRWFTFLLLVLSSLHVGAATKPNIVFFLADDLGQRDLGCYGSSFYETPNLDRLAKDGAKFTEIGRAHV